MPFAPISSGVSPAAGQAPADPSRDPRAWFAPPPAIKKVQRAIFVARFNGWTLVVGAALAPLLELFSVTGLVTGMMVGVCAFLELRGAKRLAALDPGAPRHLALNQLLLTVFALGYCAQRYWATLHGTNPAFASLNQSTGDASIDQTLKDLVPVVAVLMYATLAVSVAAVCGGMSIYYLTRRRWIEAALALQQRPAPPGGTPHLTLRHDAA